MKHREDINQKAKDEYKANKDAILRRHILWNLNTNNTRQPKKETIELYNLKFDNTLNKWY